MKVDQLKKPIFLLNDEMYKPIMVIYQDLTMDFDEKMTKEEQVYAFWEYLRNNVSNVAKNRDADCRWLLVLAINQLRKIIISDNKDNIPNLTVLLSQLERNFV